MIVKTGKDVTEKELEADNWTCEGHATCGEFVWRKEGYTILHHRGEGKITIVPENMVGKEI